MLMLISPAKSLDFESPDQSKYPTQPDFLAQSQDLVNILRDYAPFELASLMKISEQLAQLNYQRFNDFHVPFDGNNAKAALSFFREIGLQVIIAAPPESEIKTGPYVDKTYTILRNGDQVYIDHHAYKNDGKKLLESDDHNVNPEILSALIKEVEMEFGGPQID